MKISDLELTPRHGSGRITPGARFLVVFDVDSTLIDDEVIEVIAESSGLRDEVAEITARAMNGELNFEESLRERVALLRGITVDEASRVTDRLRITQGVPETIDAIHSANGRVGAVSGGFHEVLDTLAEQLDLDLWRANRFETTDDGILTGNVSGTIIGRQTKLHTLRSWAQSLDVPMDRVVAVGDGANDLGMMSIAGCSVAFDAKPIVRQEAAMSMPFRDMTQLLPVLGLRG